ncbi:MAG: Trk family potassium uptake protein [Clostridiales bacterium]|nr:Trk family potassium uptake protein [Clostridiales bacterium]
MEKTKKRINISPSLKILIGFLGIIIIGSLLLCLPFANRDGHWLSYSDAFFTSTSAVCVTGLIVVDTAVQFTLFGQIVVLLLIQVGGLGIVAITTLIALVMGKKINLSSRLTLQESLNKDSMEGVVKTLKKILVVTLIIELVGACLLSFSTISITDSVGYGIFAAIFMSVSAFCNAGFDVFGMFGGEFASLTPFANNVMLLLPIAMLIILGGLGFVVLFNFFKSFKGKQHAIVVVCATIILLLVGTISFMILEWNNPLTLGGMTTFQKIINSFFQSTTLRTAGFASIDQGGLTTACQIISMLLMFIGGSPNSTAGGLKTTTLIIIFMFLFKKPNEKGDITFGNRRISGKVVRKSIKLFLAQLFTLLVFAIVISFIDADLSISAIMFECVSAICTVGLTMGITTSLSVISQMLLCVLMFVGRVGLLTVGLAMSSAQSSADFEYQNTDIIVG